MSSDFPVSGQVKLIMKTERASRYRLALRVPEWCPRFIVIIGKKSYYGSPGIFLNIVRKWNGEETVDIDFEIPVKFESGEDSYPLSGKGFT